MGRRNHAHLAERGNHLTRRGVGIHSLALKVILALPQMGLAFTQQTPGSRADTELVSEFVEIPVNRIGHLHAPPTGAA